MITGVTKFHSEESSNKFVEKSELLGNADLFEHLTVDISEQDTLRHSLQRSVATDDGS